jgi:hypothetical protein
MMNNLFRNVNTFGLMGIILAAGLVFTQSAFKPAKSNKAALIYGYDYTSRAWVLVEPGNGYQCIEAVTPCKFTFATPPSADTRPEDSTPLDNDLGSYED